MDDGRDADSTSLTAGRHAGAVRRRETATAALQRRNHELAVLNAIAQALNREVDLDQTLRVALARVAALLDLQTGWVWLLDDTSGAPYLAAAQNLPPALSRAPRRMEGSCYCLDTYQCGDLRGAANVNVVTCSRLKNLIDGTDGLRYHASIPLYAHGKQLGVLNVASADWRELAADDLQLLYTIGDLVSIAVERARLFARGTRMGAVEERNRLAREIHDTLAQGLAAIALKLETADALLAAGAAPSDLQPLVDQALRLARTSLDEARRSVLDLRAAPLEDRSLPDALRALAETYAATAGLPVGLDLPASPRPLPVRVEVGLYRMVQEALTNIRRHAQANRATVRLRLTPRQARLSIEDDGRGFDPAQVPPERFGLIGLNERARLLGGRLQVRSRPGAGTRLDVIVPLEGGA
jgi:two-component system NarL family sensor kinase